MELDRSPLPPVYICYPPPIALTMAQFTTQHILSITHRNHPDCSAQTGGGAVFVFAFS